MRGLLAVPLFAILTVFIGFPTLLIALFDRSGIVPNRLARLWSRLLLWGVGIRVEVSGVPNVVKGPALFAANHSSALDIPIVFGHLPVDFRIIHKRSLILLPMIGWFLFLSGHIAIDRGRAFRARRSLEAAARRIAAGTSVVVFPEGTRSPDGHVGVFKRGSFLLAMSAGVPVVPVSLDGVKRLMPSGLLSLRAGLVKMEILPARSISGRSPEEAEALAEEVRQAVQARLGSPV